MLVDGEQTLYNIRNQELSTAFLRVAALCTFLQPCPRVCDLETKLNLECQIFFIHETPLARDRSFMAIAAASAAPLPLPSFAKSSWHWKQFQ